MTLVVWVLDSADIDLMARWTADRSLPNIAALWKSSFIRIVGGASWFDEIGSWLTAYSGIPQTQHGYHCARRLKPGTYSMERMRVADARARPCWQEMKDPDFRALIWEATEAAPVPGIAGTQVYNLTAHQEAYAAEPPVAVPEGTIESIRRNLGRHRTLRFNRFGNPAAYYQAQLRANLSLLDRKSPILRGFVRDGRYDLIVIGFNEIHDAGHLLWSFMDGRSPGRDPEGKLADGVHMLYRRIDREIGAVMELLPAGSTVCMLSTYGMQDQYPTLDLAEDFMLRLGYQTPRAAQPGARRLLPESLRHEISKHLPSKTQQRLLFSGFAGKTDFARSRAFVVPTSLYTSQIRVNLKGREPAGTIAGGKEYGGLLDEIEADLHQLIDPVDGQPAVRQVVRTAGYHIEGPSEAMPDLFIHWKPGRHFMDRVIHPRAEIRQRKSGFHRDSGHRKPGFAAISGPGIRPASGPIHGEASLLDIAPTLLHLMGGKTTPSMPGRSLL
jgi:predicted AlkP superfamily phosphohydrolase/phosphomutase